MTFHCAFLFSYTSMWSTQRVEAGDSSAIEVQEHVSNIFQIANRVLQQSRFGKGFIAFPVFVAGVSSTAPAQKTLALEMLLTLKDNADAGCDITTTRALMLAVYHRQTSSYYQRGHCLDVDWIQVMVEEGLRMETFGV